jgi:hypothetical protein
MKVLSLFNIELDPSSSSFYSFSRLSHALLEFVNLLPWMSLLTTCTPFQAKISHFRLFVKKYVGSS